VEVFGLEEYEPSIIDAARNCEENRVGNAAFSCSEAAAGVKNLAAAGKKFDVVLLDPPRTGAAEVVGHIHALEPRRILYVSCDPATLARDIGILKKSGYDVVKSLPVDMFPQTYHIESVTMLEPACRRA
jgi:23S rRNA (uracil1939-C5)-methyltransferase